MHCNLRPPDATPDLSALVSAYPQRRGVHRQLFADDMQGHCSRRLDHVPEIVSRLESCIIDICAWRGAKRLQLNADKTELLWFGPVSQLRRLPSHNNSINVNQCVVKPVNTCRSTTARLVTALVLSRLDYCNAVLAGLPVSALAPFQWVLHTAARTVMDLKPRDSSSSRVALVASRWYDPVQAVFAGSQVAFGIHAGIYLRPSDIGCQHSRSIYTACFIMW